MELDAVLGVHGVLAMACDPRVRHQDEALRTLLRLWLKDDLRCNLGLVK
jgi:hypothetical protein